MSYIQRIVQLVQSFFAFTNSQFCLSKMKKGGKYGLSKGSQQAIGKIQFDVEALMAKSNTQNVVTIEKEAFQQLLKKLEELSNQVSNTPTMACDEWITSEQVMDMFKISSRTLQNWRDKGKIGFSKVSHKVILYCREDVLGLLKLNYFKTIK